MAFFHTSGSVDRVIDKIYVNGFPGVAFGGNIFNCEVELGDWSKPTSITLSIIEAEGNYQIAEDETDALNNNYPYPSYLTPWIIQIGEAGANSSPLIFKMYLEAWDMDLEMGEKTLKAKFVDGSTMLDRIYVGLIDKHINPDLPSSKNTISGQRIVEFTLPIVCETLMGECGDLNKFGNCTGLVDRSETRTIGQRGGFGIRRGDRREEGGALFLGFHEINTKNVGQECAVPTVKYNFSDLLYLMSVPESLGGFGINILNKWGTQLPSLWDKDPLYFPKETRVGTLRKVLGDWCADFGFEPLWS